MSRFGIRKRLKSMLDGTGDRTETVHHSVTFLLPDGSRQVVEAEERYTLLMASEKLPSPIGTGRRAGGTCPDGMCGLCQVDIVDATGLSPQTEDELAVMKAFEAGEPHEGRPREPGPKVTDVARLGCHCRIVGSGGVVKVRELMSFEAIRGD